MKKITFILFALVCSFGFSQTFTDGGGPYDIQTAGGTAATCGTMSEELTLPLAVTGIGTLGGALSIESVTLNITHTWNDDIVISLQDPSGTVTVLLTDDNGGNGDGFVNVVLQDGFPALPDGNTDPITGTFAPDEALAAFNLGVVADGTWNLLVCDDAGGDVGAIDNWSITFAPTPSCSTPANLAAGNLTDTTADLSWADVSTATLGFEWGILAPGGDPLLDTFLFSGSTAATVVTDLASGLTAETDYEVFVRSNCDGAGFSDWSLATAFTTTVAPPVNDNACDAIALNIGDITTTAAYTNVGASLEANEGGGSCYLYGSTPDETVWFSFTAPASGEVRIVTEQFAGSGSTLTDSEITLFTLGDCSDLTTAVEIACDEDDDNDIVGNGGGFQANLEVTGLTAGAAYYFVVDGYFSAEGTFDISLTDATLSVDSLETKNAFTYFPNPVKNELTLSAQKDIDNVSVYNMLGQEVLRTAPNAVDSTINMDGFSQGAYFVKVTIGNITETIRIIKQ